jgi:FixJ family two-component response regulator
MSVWSVENQTQGLALGSGLQRRQIVGLRQTDRGAGVGVSDVSTAGERLRADLIALVEDDQSVLEALEGLLVSAGYEVRSYSSGEAFLSAGRQQDIACVITDIGVPGINGIELLRRLRSEGANLPAIMITARHDKALLEAALKAGARHVLLKPLNSDDLLSAIAAIC